MKEFVLLLPEVILALTLVFVVVAEITYHGEQFRFVTLAALLGLGAAFVQTLITYQYGPIEIFSGALSIDGLSLFFKILFIALAALSIVSVSHTSQIPESRRTEFSALVLAATLAMCLAASASDTLLIFLSLQLLNIMTYFLTGYGKKSILSIEAGVKYMIFSCVAGVLLLYGLAILFSLSHTLNLYEIHRALMATIVPKSGLVVVFMLVFLALSFQIASFPMYLWAPDVLEGAPTPSAAFISIATRAAGFAVAIRFIIVVFAQPSLTEGQWEVLGSVQWTNILGFISGTTMLVGALLAMRQNSAKRMVGCLAVAQSGFLLMGILVLDQVGVAALLYNLVIELFALMGIFSILSYFFEERRSDLLPDLKGMLEEAIPECICLFLFLLCVVGVPPSPGFIGKFTLIGAVVRHQGWGLATLAIFSLTLSMVAIARLSFHLIGDLDPLRDSFGPGVAPRALAAVPSLRAPSRASGRIASQSASPSVRSRRIFLMTLLLPVLLAGFFANSLLGWAGKSLGFILW